MEFDFKMFSVHNNTHGLNFLHVAYRIVVFLDKMVCVNYLNDNHLFWRLTKCLQTPKNQGFRVTRKYIFRLGGIAPTRAMPSFPVFRYLLLLLAVR